MDNEPSWQRQLAIGLSALLAVGILIGGIIAVIAVRAADYVGIGGASSSSSPDLILPTTGDATRHTAPPTRPSSPSPATTSKPPPAQHAIRLVASPRSVGSFGRINLTGGYPGHDGTTLQVQRSLGHGSFSDFPTTTTVHTGSFATYVQTSMTGVNHFRMLDSSTGKTSNAVTVTVG